MGKRGRPASVSPPRSQEDSEDNVTVRELWQRSTDQTLRYTAPAAASSSAGPPSSIAEAAPADAHLPVQHPSAEQQFYANEIHKMKDTMHGNTRQRMWWLRCLDNRWGRLTTPEYFAVLNWKMDCDQWFERANNLSEWTTIDHQYYELRKDKKEILERRPTILGIVKPFLDIQFLHESDCGDSD